jgi:hypothetical protein
VTSAHRDLAPDEHLLVEGGWRQLYLDPRDGRRWELTFPQGSLHGGGPRRLECVAALVAADRYGVKLG